jgi:hypothetical protein
LTPILYGKVYASLRYQSDARGLACQGVQPGGGIVMAIQDYVKSIAATDTVSKDQVFRFLEMQFARADKNHDGLLDIDELAVFAQSLSLPESDQR